jgi:hypothetical protein
MRRRTHYEYLHFKLVDQQVVDVLPWSLGRMYVAVLQCVRDERSVWGVDDIPAFFGGDKHCFEPVPLPPPVRRQRSKAEEERVASLLDLRRGAYESNQKRPEVD